MRAKPIFKKMKEDGMIGVHISHCFEDDPECFGGFECCKYGDEFCPADPKCKDLVESIINGE